MNIKGRPWRTIWLEEEGNSVGVIDQTKLPHNFITRSLGTCEDVADAIRTMVVRGAPLIGVAGAYGLMLALKESPDNASLEAAFELLIATRPTAVNLQWALKRVFEKVKGLQPSERAQAAKIEAMLIEKEDVAMCEAIGKNGLKIIKKLIDERTAKYQNKPLNILTHCNAGWLATVDWGTALSPIYKAHREGLRMHIWVDETRPRNQGANLTAYELCNEEVPHTLIVDNAGGHLMQHGLVDAVIVGADRITRTGDVCNKIGTYLKALAAKDNDVPFYVAIPSSTIDWNLQDGLSEIPIENRSGMEITHMHGLLVEDVNSSNIASIQISPSGSQGFNPAFDVTPAGFVTALITELGVTPASENGLKMLYPER